MNVRETLKNVNIMLDGLEGTRQLTQKEKNDFGWERWNGREYYNEYKAKNYLAFRSCDRNRISKAMLKEMKTFLTKAEKMGFYGKVEFKCGYTNGMWASTRDYSTAEERIGQIVLYHTFTSEYKYWQLRNEKDLMIGHICNTDKEIKDMVKEYNEGKIA